ncbi:MAG: GHKL domain-containing protein [Candidatus Omnitrophica bacterium]|nr:GHKL domain-containing protein [Candidatus Omnitrophota bacterium]MCF7876762.1 GHKL domain-containing protein [Candidatus Omnitrophota bacterium]MCF7892678.1 GHKL domain-containing protein [Candidatus Omnitrophota bacterium]
MFVTIILILFYWFILSLLSLLIGGNGYLQAFFPLDSRELIFRFVSIFFILLGNLYLLSKLGKDRKKEAIKKEDNELKQYLPEIRPKKDINLTGQSFIYKVANSMLKVSFSGISLATFAKLALALIVSEKHFINCVGAVFFSAGNQPNFLTLKASYNMPFPLPKECKNVSFQKCICGEAAQKKTIQFSENHKNCPFFSEKKFFKGHNHYCVPLINQGNLLGVVNLILAPGSKRTKESDRYLMDVANAMALGIEHKQEMGQTTEINKCLSELTGQPHENIKKLLHLYGEVSESSCAFYKRHNPKTGILTSLAQYRPPRYYDDQEAEDSIGQDIINSRKPLMVIRGLTETKYIKKDLNIIRNDFITCVGSVVKLREEPIGAVYAFYQLDFIPGRKSQEHLKMIASAIGREEERIYENKVLKEAYSKLKKAQNSLVQSEKLAALGRFASGIAHEVKNPLGVILGGVEFLQKKIVNPDKSIVMALEKVKDSTLRANKIVQNLLTFSKPSARKHEVIDLRKLIEETLSLLGYKVSLVNIKIINEVKHFSQGVVGDKNQIQQVLFNLFLNAIEAMPKGGKLKIRAHKVSGPKGHKEKNSCVVEIADTGEGIPEQNLAKIFEPFFTTKRDSKGTGLGLAMCKMIVENNQGKLAIKSKLDKGTTAEIFLPLNTQD